MGRKRKISLEAEYELERTVEDLKQQIEKLTKRIRQLEKIKKEEKEELVVKKIVEIKQECPKCGAILKSTTLPFGTLFVCETGCGFREVRR
jgi:hypothetical protein